MTPPPAYQLLDELGHGGQAVVYRARQTSLDRIVALKVIQTSSAADSELELRLRRESRMLSRVDHPNLVKIFGSGELDGRPYLAMELVEGKTLKDLIESDPMDTRRRADALFDAILGAIESLHAAQLIHRDLKPSNVMVTPNWRAVVMDLGLGKDLADGTVATLTGLTVGTPAFMAPEVVLGEPASGAADVWALGCLYYAMHAGRSPFTEPTMRQLIEAITQRPISNLDVACPHLSPARKALLLRLLDRDRASRPADAAAVRTLWLDSAAKPPSGRRRPSQSRPLSGETTTFLEPRGPHRHSMAGLRRGLATGAVVVVLLAMLVSKRWMLPSTPVPAGTPAIGRASPAGPSARPSAENKGTADLLAPPSPLPLSWRWRVYEAHRRVLESGGEAASQVARKLYRDEGHILGREPMLWLRWMDLNRWLESRKDRPWKSYSPFKKLQPVTELFLLGQSVSGTLKREPPSLFEMTVGWIYTSPRSGFGWMLLGYCLESEGPESRPKAIRAYREGLAMRWPTDVSPDKEEIWQLLARALIQVPGHDIEKEWWGHVAGPEMENAAKKNAVMMGLCRATAPDTGLFLRIFETVPPRLNVTVDETLAFQRSVRRDLCNPGLSRALLLRLWQRHPEAEHIGRLLHQDHLEGGDTVGARRLAIPALINHWEPIIAYYEGGPRAPDIVQNRDIAKVSIASILSQADQMIERGDVAAARRLMEGGGLPPRLTDPFEFILVTATVLNAAGPSPELEAPLARMVASLENPYMRFHVWNHLAGTFSTAPSQERMERLLARATCDPSLIRALWDSRSGRFNVTTAPPPSPEPHLVGDHWFRSALFEIHSRPLIEKARGRSIPVAVLEACQKWKSRGEPVPMVDFLTAVRSGNWAAAARSADLVMNSQELEPFWPLALSWTSHLAAPRADHRNLDARVRAALRHRHALWALREVP